MLLMICWSCVSTIYPMSTWTWWILMMMLNYGRGVVVPIDQFCFWCLSMFVILLSYSLMNCGWIKFWTAFHGLVFIGYYHSILITDIHRLFISRRCNNWINYNAILSYMSSIVIGWCIWYLYKINYYGCFTRTEH